MTLCTYCTRLLTSDTKVTFDVFFVRLMLLFHLHFNFLLWVCLYSLSCTLFPVAVLGTHCCHVPVSPFLSLDWCGCLWLVSLSFFQ